MSIENPATDIHTQLRLLFSAKELEHFYTQDKDDQLDLLSAKYTALKGANQFSDDKADAFNAAYGEVLQNGELTHADNFPLHTAAHLECARDAGFSDDQIIDCFEWIDASIDEPNINDVCNAFYIYAQEIQRGNTEPDHDTLDALLEAGPLPEESSLDIAGDNEEENEALEKCYARAESDDALEPKALKFAREYAGLQLARETLDYLDAREECESFFAQVVMNDNVEPDENDHIKTLEELLIEMGRSYYATDSIDDCVMQDDQLDRRGVYYLMQVIANDGQHDLLAYAANQAIITHNGHVGHVELLEQKSDQLREENLALTDENEQLKSELMALRAKYEPGQEDPSEASKSWAARNAKPARGAGDTPPFNIRH